MSKGNYEVGYGKPPASGRFKKGQSGNPKGRPKGRKAMNSIIEDVLRRKVVIREGGKTKKIPQVEALIRRIVNDGLKGDGKATDQALKLFQMSNSTKDDKVVVDDGTIPDREADRKVLETFLKLYDLPTEVLGDGGGEGE